jgi:hypothetical protein
MRWFHRLCLLYAVLLVTAAAAADLTKIERAIAKQPAYESKNVKYCLLVFGPEADKRVWMAWDGKNLFVDGNGNGDLTEEGEKVASLRKPPGEEDYVELGEAKLPAFGEGCRLDVSLEKDTLTLTLEGKGIPRHYASPKMASQPAKATIVHFGGPLTMELNDRELNCRDKSPEVYAVVGTRGLGEGSFASISHDVVPPGSHPVAEIQFPSASANVKPVTLTVELSGRC